MQVADLGLPQGPGPHPVAVLVHGGFWRVPYRRDQMEPLAADLRHRGWATWNVEYRAMGPRWRGGGGGWPVTCEDVAAAVDRLAGVDAPLDLARVVAIGHSAGGHLALWAAGRRDARVPLAGAVGQGAVCDLERGARLQLSRGVVQDFCGGEPEEAPEAYRGADPVARVPAGIPQLLVHGDRDPNVPVELATSYAAAARAAGDDVTLVVRPGEGHFEHLDPTSMAWRAVTDWLEERFP
jgi:dipeptidyl aminopeptidase/acylaminoacyl peptidase